MPFTGSHPAAILPLLSLGLPASGLVIGTVVPDLPYFVPSPFDAAQTHTLVGVVGADLVLGIGAFLTWQLLLVRPLVWLAPDGLRRRLPDHAQGELPTRRGSARDLILACIALMIGALTHVVWDSFTHAGMWGPQTLPWLNTPVLGLETFRWLQYVSSVVGLACLGWYGARWWRAAAVGGASGAGASGAGSSGPTSRATDGPTSDAPAGTGPPAPAIRWALWAGLLGWAGLAALRIAGVQVAAAGRVSRQQLVIASTIEFVSALLVGTLLAALAWHVVRLARPEWVGLTPSRTQAEATTRT